jgi:prolyl 4-hydroxylase
MVTEDWVLELIGHDGYAINVTMQPGEMIMYESHSILHGRPYPLNGQYYANCFFHFEPIGYTEQYYANLERQRRRRQTQQQPPQSSNADSSSSSSNSATGSSIHIPTTQELYEAALAKLAKTEPGLTSMSLSTTTNPSDASSEMPETSKRPLQLPFSILEGTIEAQRWRQEFEFRRVTLRHESWDDNGNGMIDETMFPKIIPKSLNKANAIGATNAHILAAKNDIVRLRKLAQTDPKSLDSTDNNGWLPLHEAARGGSTEVVQFLVEEVGIADINARTNNGKGGTALWWAEHGLPSNHKVIQILKRNGAISIAPFQEKKFEKYKKNPKAKGDNEEDRKGENTESDKEDKEGDVEEDEE